MRAGAVCLGTLRFGEAASPVLLQNKAKCKGQEKSICRSAEKEIRSVALNKRLVRVICGLLCRAFGEKTELK